MVEPADRTEALRNAARIRWRYMPAEDRAAATARARAAAFARFMREVDPGERMPWDQRVARAEDARRAFLATASRRGVEARHRQRHERHRERAVDTCPLCRGSVAGHTDSTEFGRSA